MSERYWLVHPNGGRQLIDPRQFDLNRLIEQARLTGGRLVVESDSLVIQTDLVMSVSAVDEDRRFEAPVAALRPLFRSRFDRIYECKVGYELDINSRPTTRVLGGYYKTRRLVRIYTHDRQSGRRPTEELFDTFLHEMAHHLEYTEPDSYNAHACQRVPGRMHSALFWLILGDLKKRWADLQRGRLQRDGTR